jgi:hypothetical protein
MTRKSWTTPILFIITLIVLTFSFFALLQNQTNFFFALIAVWGIALPIISDLPYSQIYLLSIPAPLFGTLFVLMLLTSKYIELTMPVYWILVVISAVLVSVFHVLTRSRTMIWKFSMAYVSRAAIGVSSIILLALAMVVVNPSLALTNTHSELFYFSAALVAYIASSMLYVNSSFRRFVVNKRIGTSNMNSFLSHKWEEINKEYSAKQNDVNLLQHYFDESYTSFLEGNFEKCLLEGYKVIREKTVVNPKEIVDDKREDKPSFNEIRNTLQHSRRNKSHVELEKIRKVIKNLYNDCLDLLEREIVFIQKVAGIPLNEIKGDHYGLIPDKTKNNRNKQEEEKK